MVKLIYSEKATNFCEISTVDFSYVKVSYLEIRWSSHNFSQKTNQMHSGYYPECVWFVFLGEVTARQLCFEIY